ncbi:ADP-ribosyl cyclase/cyclic ADP-ribose hydrolase 1-like [Mercenaria mercenaria]|uniref:ADP-ribosyl cyclase/cyclic ADP-ribose hydrolase 1-like n=1 Tax=Mercenaria mercenaria TaxID=6596 RepID=UPI00234EDBB3|nr:ADP-ribosyl cyclase/cyclic ADP-ribose hydrolase 1-like [Mercenaria mercenaria]
MSSPVDMLRKPFCISNIFAGYLINGVHFCGRTTGNSSYESCEAWNPVTCPNTASGSFWEAASTNFAKNAVGDVYVLLNGTRNPIFKSSSYFTKYEAPNLRGGTVTKLTAILINDSPKTKRDLCNNDDSLKILKSIVKTKGIEFVCKENPRDLVYLFCIDNSSTDLCTSVNMYHDGNASTCRACFSPQLLLLLLALLNVLK